MKLTLGFSPCPNDTFIFDALVNKKINTGLDFEVVLEDVQTLNEWAMQGKLDITKISYGVLPGVLANYAVLNAGSALGKGVGPLLISKSFIANSAINEKKIAIPVKVTAAKQKADNFKDETEIRCDIFSLFHGAYIQVFIIWRKLARNLSTLIGETASNHPDRRAIFRPPQNSK